jgi:hypothetical protein
MMKYAAVPLLAMLAACSAERESGEAETLNTVETSTTNNLIVAQDDAATAADNMAQTQDTAPTQAGQTTAPAPAAPTARTAPAEPRPTITPRPSTEASQVSGRTEPAPVAEPKAATPESSCSPEHREMGHC